MLIIAVYGKHPLFPGSGALSTDEMRLNGCQCATAVCRHRRVCAVSQDAVARASTMHGDTAACHFDGIVRVLCLSDRLRHHIKLENNSTSLAARQAAAAAAQALAECVPCASPGVSEPRVLPVYCSVQQSGAAHVACASLAAAAAAAAGDCVIQNRLDTSQTSVFAAAYRAVDIANAFGYCRKPIERVFSNTGPTVSRYYVLLLQNGQTDQALWCKTLSINEFSRPVLAQAHETAARGAVGSAAGWRGGRQPPQLHRPHHLLRQLRAVAGPDDQHRQRGLGVAAVLLLHGAGGSMSFLCQERRSMDEGRCRWVKIAVQMWQLA